MMEDLAPRLEMKLYYFKSSNSPTGSASEKISMLSKFFNLQTQHRIIIVIKLAKLGDG